MESMRYRRQLPVIGKEGQQKLARAKVLCIGAGGLGCAALPYLVGAGVGHITIVDGDTVELSNLHRQTLFTEDDIGQPKAATASTRLKRMNSTITITPIVEFLTRPQAEALIPQHDIIIDATDNYPTRYLVNEISRAHQVPLVFASIFQFDAQLSVFNYQQGPCYQCLYPSPPPDLLAPNCASAGVLGVLPGIAGSLQAAEAIKALLNMGDVLSGKLLSIDIHTLRFRTFEINKQTCSNHPLLNLSTGTNNMIKEIDSLTLKNWQDEDKAIQLIDVREQDERDICHIGGTLIPLHTLPQHLSQLNTNQPTVIYCKSGGRSYTACQFLAEHGFREVYNLKGGILDWINTVDSSLLPY